MDVSERPRSIAMVGSAISAARVGCAIQLGWVADGRLAGRRFPFTEPIRGAFRYSRTRAEEGAFSAKTRITDRCEDRLNQKEQQ